jgi:ATP-dependent exoDNAse (exonuclease V) alpha subunit
MLQKGVEIKLEISNGVITLNAKQEQAVRDSKKWFNEEHFKNHFVIAGYAGTGKTTVVKFIIDALGLTDSDVCFCSYTGRATLMLKKKGNQNVRTMHKLIYKTIAFPDPETGEMHFTIRPKTKDEVEKYSLIVVDELSMIPDHMLKILCQQHDKVLALGDIGQLPPVEGKRNDWIAHPDIVLTEIMRQAKENPIIYLSFLARRGQGIPYGKYGDKAIVIPKQKLTEDLISSVDQLVSASNSTNDKFNRFIRRKIKGIDSDEPVVGDKICCLHNDWHTSNGDIQLVNGTLGTLKEISLNKKLHCFDLDMLPLDSKNQFQHVHSEIDCFRGNEYLGKMPKLSESQFKERKHRRSKNHDFMINEFMYGYCITCHKAQGSEFDRLLVLNSRLRGTNHAKWLYTAITRAADYLILAQ